MTGEPDFRKRQGGFPLRAVTGFFLLFWLFLLLLSLLSYSAADPSINHAVSSKSEVSNMGGVVGSYVAGFFNDLFGTGSLVLPLILAVFSIRCLTRKPPLAWWRWVGLGCLSFACLVFAQAVDFSIGDLRGGGFAGQLLLSASRRLLSPFGSTLFWLFLFVIGLQLFVSLPINEVVRRFRERFTYDSGEEGEAEAGEDVPRATRLLFGDETKPGTVLGRVARTAVLAVPATASFLISLIGRKKRSAAGDSSGQEPEAHGILARTVARGIPLVEENIPFARTEEAGVPLDRAYAEQYAAPDRVAVYAPYQLHAAVQGGQPGNTDDAGAEAGASLKDKKAGKRNKGLVGSLFDLLPSKVPSLEDDSSAGKAESLQNVAEEAGASGSEDASCAVVHEQTGIEDEKNESLSERDALRQALFAIDDEPESQRQGSFLNAAEKDALTGPAVPLADPVSFQDDKSTGLNDFYGREAVPAGQEAAGKPADDTETDGIAGGTSSAAAELFGSGFAVADTAIHIAADAGDNIPDDEAGDNAGVFSATVSDAVDEPENDDPDDVQEILVPQNAEYVLPPLALLQKPEPAPADTEEDVEQRSELLMSCLADFGIQAELVRATPGPVVTTYMLRPARGVSVRAFTRHTEDIARSLMAVSVFVQAPVPGTDTVGIVIPNCNRSVVNFREIASSPAFQQAGGALPLVVGKDTTGRPYVSDLARMPHLLVAGATGQGKSVCLNAMLTSLLLTRTPQELKLLLVDPKRVEMGMYEDESHLVHPVVKEVSDAKNALLWAVAEMDQRYNRMARLYTKNIKGYNEKLASYKGNLPPELADLEPMPYIVIVIDELADLMLQARKDVEPCIIRLAQLARACGIHMIIATQRPSVDVVTGLIKANFPCRICFRVSSRQDSITTLGSAGAEKLLGNGDMFFNPNGGHLTRLHGPFLRDEEVQSVVAFWKKQCRPKYEVDFSTWGEEDTPRDTGVRGRGVSSKDAMYQEVLEFIREQGEVSISLLQRRFYIGYNKAARYMDQLDADGLVGPSPGAGKARPVLMH